MSTQQNLAAHIGAKVEEIRFQILRENGNGAYLYEVYDLAADCNYYVIEGETGELLGQWENLEEATDNWNVTL